MKLWPFKKRPKRHRIRILFKSGNFIDATCQEFSTKYKGDDPTSLEWKGMKPDPGLFLALNQIEAIVEYR